MSLNSQYFRKRLIDQDIRVQNIMNSNKSIPNITGKKRKYEEAMGYSNDYIVVQSPESIENNSGENWKDAYLENLVETKK
jgi:hypothetical protein